MEYSMFVVNYRYYECGDLEDYGHAYWDVDQCEFDTLDQAQAFIVASQDNPDIRGATLAN
jgi:hypothetical protein